MLPQWVVCRCRVLQCAAVSCSELQYVAMCCSALQGRQFTSDNAPCIWGVCTILMRCGVCVDVMDV